MQNLFWLLLFLMPFLSVSPWQAFISPPFYYGYVYYFILAFTAVIVFISEIRRNKKIKIDWNLIFLLLFFMAAIISVILNWRITEGMEFNEIAGIRLPHNYNLFLLVYLALNILTVWLTLKIIQDVNQLKKAIGIIVFSGSIACVYGILKIFLAMLGLISKDQEILYMFPRLIGTATEAQVFGSFLVLIIPLSFVLFVANIKKTFAVLLFIALLAMAMTFSAGGWIGVSAAFILLCPFTFKRLFLHHYLAIAIMAVGIIGSLFIGSIVYPPYFDHMKISKLLIWQVRDDVKTFNKTRSYPDTDDKLDRLWMAQAAINQFKYRPILGIGYGNYGFMHDAFRAKGSSIRGSNAKTHNVYLEVLAETGMAGFIIFFSGIINILFIALRNLIKTIDADARTCFAGIIAAFFGLLVNGASFGVFAHNYTWMALGLILAAARIYGKDQS